MVTTSARFVASNKLAQYDVINTKGEDMGQVQTFVIDMRVGLIAFALVSYGGFLGISDKWFVLPWPALEWHPGKMKFVLDMPEQTLKDAPGLQKDKWLEEVDKWQDEKNIELLDRYYTHYGYESYQGVVQQIITWKGRRKWNPV